MPTFCILFRSSFPSSIVQRKRVLPGREGTETRWNHHISQITVPSAASAEGTDGPGVRDSQLADIFRPFFRVAEARERTSGGTGIGLAISKGSVTLHGGSIRACDAAGGGLEVEIRLPVSRATQVSLAR